MLRVGATPQVIENLLADFLTRYRRRHPGVEVHLVEDGGARLPGRLERGDVHLAHMPAGDDRFHGRLLYPMHVLAVLPETHRLGRRAVLEIADLADEPLLLLRRGFASREWFNAACQVAHIRPRVLLESAAPHTLVALARADYGIALVPSTVRIARDGVRVVPVVHRGAIDRQMGGHRLGSATIPRSLRRAVRRGARGRRSAALSRARPRPPCSSLAATERADSQFLAMIAGPRCSGGKAGVSCLAGQSDTGRKTTMRQARFMAVSLAAVGMLAAWQSCHAQDQLKIAVGGRGIGETFVTEVGYKAGLFNKHNLVLDIFYTDGGGETQQAVISNSAQIGIASGFLGAMGVFAKGAPVRVIGGSYTGGAQVFWYVPAASPIKAARDLDGKTVAYSNNGSSTHAGVLALAEALQAQLQADPTGNAAATMTAAMSGQVDAGWAGAPFGVAELEAGKTRMIMKSSDAPDFDKQTSRVIIANAVELKARPDAFVRFMRGYRDALVLDLFVARRAQGLCSIRQAAGGDRQAGIAGRTGRQFRAMISRSPRCTAGVAGRRPTRRRSGIVGRRALRMERRRRREMGVPTRTPPMRSNGSRRRPSASATRSGRLSARPHDCHSATMSLPSAAR